MQKEKKTSLFFKKQLKIKNKWKKSKIQISKDLRDILHGYIMSDGYVRNGILTVDQSKKQRRFVQWLYDKLKPITHATPIKKVVRVHPSTSVTSDSFRFSTKAVLHGFHSMWYEPITNKQNLGKDPGKGRQRYRKKLPQSIDAFFNETFISVWYAGDGTKTIGSLGAKFEVTNFTVKERLKLQSLFLTKFDIKTSIIQSGVSKKNNQQWALKIPAKEYPKFRTLITKHDLIPTLFPYKLHKKI